MAQRVFHFPLNGQFTKLWPADADMGAIQTIYFCTFCGCPLVESGASTTMRSLAVLIKFLSACWVIVTFLATKDVV